MLRNDKGSGMFKVLIYLAIVAYIGLLIVRFASISIKYKDLEVKIRDLIRNSIQCDKEELMEKIYNLLDEKRITPKEDEIFVECKGNKAKVSFSYEDVLDGILFKKKIIKIVNIEGVIG